MYNYPYGDNQQINLNWIISEIIALHQRLDPDYTAPTFTQIYPFSETQQLNLDWILAELKALKDLAPTPPPTELIDEIGQALIAGAYDAETSYQKNDYIVQDGKVYRANAATTGTFDPTKWNEVMLGNDLAIITRWADATNTFLNSLAASNVANDSSVTGTTVKDALDTLKTATDAAVTDVKYNAGYLKKTIGGTDSNIIQIEDSPTNDSTKLPSSKAVYNSNAAITEEATTRANADTALQNGINAINTELTTTSENIKELVTWNPDIVDVNAATNDVVINVYGKIAIISYQVTIKSDITYAAVGSSPVVGTLPAKYRPVGTSRGFYSSMTATNVVDDVPAFRYGGVGVSSGYPNGYLYINRPYFSANKFMLGVTVYILE